MFTSVNSFLVGSYTPNLSTVCCASQMLPNLSDVMPNGAACGSTTGIFSNVSRSGLNLTMFKPTCSDTHTFCSESMNNAKGSPKSPSGANSLIFPLWGSITPIFPPCASANQMFPLASRASAAGPDELVGILCSSN